MITPDLFTFSWIQARQTNLRSEDRAGLQRLDPAGFQPVALDYFYDIQVVRRQQVTRYLLADLELVLERPDSEPIIGPASLSLVFWHLGYYCLRLTLEQQTPGLTHQDLHDLHAAEHETDVLLSVRGRLGGSDLTVAGNVRRIFDWFGFYVHEVLSGRTPRADELSTWSADSESAIKKREAYVHRRELTSVYPTTFGTHAELVWHDGTQIPAEPEVWAKGLIAEVRPGERQAWDIDADSTARWWLLSEFQTILVRQGVARTSADFRALDSDRAQMIEYLAMRRGALQGVQRLMQHAAAERQPVARRDVADWTWFIAAVTDDYAIGGWEAGMLEQIKRLLKRSVSLRDVFELEAQVRRNVEAFQARMDAESDRNGTIIAILFGIVAATSLVPLAGIVFAFFSGDRLQDYSSVSVHHPMRQLLVYASLLLVLAAAATLVLVRSRRLRPPRKGRRRRSSVR